MAALGAPVAYAILSGIIVYLGVAGQDLAIAGETMVQRLFDGFLLLAVPLFIVTANIMNAGSISDRLLSFCVAVVGRFRGGLGHVNVMASLIFSGMSGSAVADAAGIGKLVIEMMVKVGATQEGTQLQLQLQRPRLDRSFHPLFRWYYMHLFLIHRLGLCSWQVYCQV